MSEKLYSFYDMVNQGSVYILGGVSILVPDDDSHGDLGRIEREIHENSEAVPHAAGMCTGLYQCDRTAYFADLVAHGAKLL